MTIMTTKTRVVIENEDSECENETRLAKNSSDDDKEADDENSDLEEDLDEGTTNAGWADSIANILRTNKPKNKKVLVLSRAKKLTEVRKVKPQSVGFQVASADGQVKDEKIDPETKDVKKLVETFKKKKKGLTGVRMKPNILEKERERILAKIATKGVVQLFNAVKSQQKEIKTKLEDAGPLEVQKERVLKALDKNTFLDVLMGGKSQNVDEVLVKSQSTSTKSETNTKETMWSVLKDDFLISAKLKDWDKEMETEEVEEEIAIESESD